MQTVIDNKVLTPQEAFDKYGPNDDRFYTSQGLDPVKQKEAVNKLNAGRKPVDSVPIETREFQKKLNELGLTEEEYYKRFNEEILPKKEHMAKRGPEFKKVKSTKIGEEVIENAPKGMSMKKISGAWDDALKVVNKIPTKGKIAIAAAAVIGVGALASGSNKKEEKEEKQQRPNYQTHVANTTQTRYDNNLMHNSYAQQMAKDISSYKYGKRMTGFN